MFALGSNPIRVKKGGVVYPAPGNRRVGKIASHIPAPMPKSPNPDTAPVAEALPATYEAAVLELEQLVARLDAGQLPLDQLLAQYQRGAQLLAFCRERLEVVENQIKVMEAGELKPWGAD